MSEEAFLRLTHHVLDALVSKMDRIISWPQRNEYQQIAMEFESFGRYDSRFIMSTMFSCLLEIMNYQNY